MKSDPLPVWGPACRPTKGPPKEVMRTGFELSAFETQISREPEREDEKAITLPSGEYFGVWSTRVEEMKSSAEAGGSPDRWQFRAPDVRVLDLSRVHEMAA